MNILVAVSGGDAPGINTTLFHLAERAAQHGDTLIGAMGGLPGIVREDFVPLQPGTLSPLAALGGSYLKTSREPIVRDAANRAKMRDVLKTRGFDHLMLFGGGGTLKYIPPLLLEMGVPSVGIPTTIDNDVAGTELTLGFHTAANFAYHLVDGVRATANALEGRLFTLETLGGDSGILALEVAYGAGADGVILPEYPDFDRDHLTERLRAAIQRKGHALLVYNEYVKGKNELIEQIAAGVGVRLRDTRLGHAQRGGAPIHPDRVLAKAWADEAYKAAQRGVPMSMTVWRGNQAGLHEGLPTGDVPPPSPARYALVNGLDA